MKSIGIFPIYHNQESIIYVPENGVVLGASADASGMVSLHIMADNVGCNWLNRKFQLLEAGFNTHQQEIINHWPVTGPSPQTLYVLEIK